MMTMAACSGRRRGQRRFEQIYLFITPCLLFLFLMILCAKVRDKWNQLVFVPMPVLNRRDRLTSGGKAGKREGFNVFNRFLNSSQEI